MLSQLGQQDVTTFETRSDVNNQLPSPHGKPSESRIAFVTACVLVMVAPESNDAWPPHPWFLLGNFSHENNQTLGVIPLLLVRNSSDVTLGTDFRGFGLRYRHMRLRTAFFDAPNAGLQAAARDQHLRREKDYLRNMLSRRQLQGFVGLRRQESASFF